MKESLDCDCGVCSICNGLRLPNESHEDAALRKSGTQPTDVQQPQPESVTGSVPHRSCKGCPEYGLDRDCSGKCP